MVLDLLGAADEADEADSVARRIIDAALAEFTDFGLRRVSVADVAKSAGVHRATAYRRFPSKDDLVVAASIVWARRFFAQVEAAVAEVDTFEDRLVEGFTIALQAFRTDPLLKRILVTDRDLMLPYLTTEGGPVLDAVTGFFAEQYRQARPDDAGVDVAAEVAARIGLSLLLTPQTRASLETDDEIRAFARRYLVALV